MTARLAKTALFLLLSEAVALAVPNESLLYVADRRRLEDFERAGMAIEQTLGALALEDVREVLSRDVDEWVQKGRGFPGRLGIFRHEWLVAARYRLVGLVYRPDETTSEMPCGELRLVYRPYRPKDLGPLPMTLLAVYPAPATKMRCLWPVSSLDGGELQRVEVNLHLAKFPTTEDESFSDQSHYLMRVFKPATKGRLTPDVLGSMPELPALVHDPEALEKLVRWLRAPDTLRSVVRGNPRLPPELAATRAISVAPYGLERLANRPYASLDVRQNLKARLQDLPFARFGLAGVDEYMDRLDATTCVGCHQRDSIAGFHFLGHRLPEQDQFLTLVEPFSPHFAANQGFRRDALKSVNEKRELASRLKVDVARAAVGRKGAACDPTLIESHAAPLADVVSPKPLEPCEGHQVCAPARAGFPKGFCAAVCGKDEADCLAVPRLDSFTPCVLATGAFRACAREKSIRVKMPACRSHTDCRQEYACVWLDLGRAACVPPYFVPEISLEGRVDGSHSP